MMRVFNSDHRVEVLHFDGSCGYLGLCQSLVIPSSVGYYALYILSVKVRYVAFIFVDGRVLIIDKILRHTGLGVRDKHA